MARSARKPAARPVRANRAPYPSPVCGRTRHPERCLARLSHTRRPRRAGHRGRGKLRHPGGGECEPASEPRLTGLGRLRQLSRRHARHAAVLLATRTPWPKPDAITGSPWLAWTGGLFGAVYVVILILLLPRLGADPGWRSSSPGRCWPRSRSTSLACSACRRIRPTLHAWRVQPCWSPASSSCGAEPEPTGCRWPRETESSGRAGANAPPGAMRFARRAAKRVSAHEG